MSSQSVNLYGKISDKLGDLDKCISLEELQNLGYIVTGEKFHVTNPASGRITYTVHELTDSEPATGGRTVTFCYVYDYPGRCGRILDVTFSEIERHRQTDS